MHEAIGNSKNTIPVFLQLEVGEQFKEAVLESPQSRLEAMQTMGDSLEGNIGIDPDFAPVATGKKDTPLIEKEFSSIEKTEQVLVRAELELDDLHDVPEMVGDARVFSDPEISTCLTCLNDDHVGTASDVANLLKLGDLHAEGHTGLDVAVAIIDAGFDIEHLQQKLNFSPSLDTDNSWIPEGVQTEPGQFNNKHGNMCAYAVLLAAPEATLLDCATFARPPKPGQQLAGHLSSVLDVYQDLWRKRTSFGQNALSSYSGLVVSNSWSVYNPAADYPTSHPGRYIDNPNHPFNLFTDLLNKSGIDLVFAAGNCGTECADGLCEGNTSNSIMGANALNSTLTVAACNVNGERTGYSSQGPGIPGMFATKPDISAYSHYLGSEAYGSGTADPGTSAACPLAAGVIAALRTNISSRDTPPSILYDQIRSSAGASADIPAWNEDTGYGIINPIKLIQARQSLGV